MKISIIIPIYNAEKYLNGCLSSIAAQTYHDFECWCVNNGSTDTSAQIIASFVQKDNRFKLINRTNAGKQAAARNAALKQATGDAVTFVDADDYIHPQMLELLFKAMIETQCDVVGCLPFNTKELYTGVFETAKPYKTKIYKNPVNAFMTKRCVPTTVWGRLYKKNVIKSLFIEDIFFEDVPFTFEIFSELPKYALITARLYGYYKGNESTMRSVWTNEKTDSYIRVIRSVSLFTSKNVPEKAKDVQKHIANGRVKMILSRIKNAPDRRALYNYAAPKIRDLYREKLISYSGLKLKHKIALYRLLHDGSKLENGAFTCISQTVYPLRTDDLTALPDVVPAPPAIKGKEIVILVGNKNKNIPDRLYQGRDMLEKMKSAGRETVPCHVAFFRNRPIWDLLSPFCRAYRNRFHAFGTAVYHIRPQDVREMNLERGQRTKENAYLYSKWPLSAEQRQKQYDDLKNSLMLNGFDDNRPVEIMLCRSLGVKDTVYQGHHRIMFCIDMNVPFIGIIFMYVSHCPVFLAKPLYRLAKFFKKRVRNETFKGRLFYRTVNSRKRRNVSLSPR